MKKTLVALSVAAFAATSANAFTAYDADGTNVQVNGSLRLALDNTSSKTKNVKRDNKHTNLRNDGSRFGVTVKHNIAEDFYALGRLELRFDKNTTADKFGDLYAKRAYVGLGSKQFGELTFGRQLTIADDIGTASFDYIYGIGASLMTDSGNSVVRYDYKGIQGLQVGLNYNFADDRSDVSSANKAEVNAGSAKSGYGAGVTYNFDVAEGQTATVEAGYTRDHYVSTNGKKSHKDAWEVALGYTVDALTIGVEGSQAYNKNVYSKDSTTSVVSYADKIRSSVIAAGVKYKVTPATSVYAGYGYHHAKKEGNDIKARTHKYLLGADYKLHKNVVTFIEGGIHAHKGYNFKAGDAGHVRDNMVALGLRVFW